MLIHLTRTGQAAQVGTLPVIIWEITDDESRAIGLAMITETVAFAFQNNLTAEAARAQLLREFVGNPRISLKPTAHLVECDGVGARVWLGETASGLKIASFVCMVRPFTSSLEAEFREVLRDLDVELLEKDDVPPMLHQHPDGPVR